MLSFALVFKRERLSHQSRRLISVVVNPKERQTYGRQSRHSQTSSRWSRTASNAPSGFP